MTTPGSIGYIEYGYARSQKVPMAVLENKAGKYVAASTESGQAALASAPVPEDMIVWASDPDGRLLSRRAIATELSHDALMSNTIGMTGLAFGSVPSSARDLLLRTR